MKIREIIYYDVAPFAALSVGASVKNEAEFSDVSKLFKENQITRSIQTCEKNYTVLDGTHFEFTNNKIKDNIAFWSRKMSGVSRNLPEEVSIEAGFGGLQSSAGIAFYFDRENNSYCDFLNIKWYRDNALLSDKNFEPDDTTYSCVNKVEFYNRVKITFYRMNMPGRYLRIESVLFGIVRIFGDDNLENLTINEGIDATGRTIYINSAEFTINAKDAVPYLFLKRQPVYINYKGARIGTFYIEKSKKYADRKYFIQAVDKIGALDNTDEFFGGIYKNKLASELIDEIIGGIFDFEIDGDIKDKMVSGWIPICKKREALAQIALAIGAVVDCTRGDFIKIRTLSNIITEIIGEERVYRTSSVNIAFPCTGVEVVEHNYIESYDEKELFKDNFTGEKIIKFSEPMYNLSIVNGVINKWGANYARISSKNSEADTILKGYAYKDNKSSVIIRSALLNEGTQEKIEKIENGYLINKDISRSTAERLYNYYLKANTFSGDFLINKDNAEKVGDIVKIATVFEEDLTGRIEKLALNLGYKNIKARGSIRGD